MFTTAGETRATALTTVFEYASSNKESSDSGAAAESSLLAGGEEPGAVSLRRKSIETCSGFVTEFIVMLKISGFRTSSQLHMPSRHTLLLECYSLLARPLELF